MPRSQSPKQVVLLRKDLKIKRATAAALVAKASTEFFIDNDESERGDKITISLTPEEAEWLSTGSTRIVLSVPTENSLRTLLFKAELSGLQCYPVTGSDGSEILCAAIGPDDSEKIDEITGNLSLF